MSTNANKDNLEKSFSAATAAVENAWDSEEAWTHLEEFCDTAGYEEKVAKVYRRALETKLSGDTFEKVAQRAVAFFNEWFGDSPREIQSLLGRIIEIDDGARWAFNRLTEILSAAGDWDGLFNMYDSALARSRSEERKKELLDEAASIARDMADAPDRALEYLLALQDLDRGNRSRMSTIERMLEKRERWMDLIALWEGQLPVMTPEESLETRLAIADCHIEKTREFEAALFVLKDILMDHPGLDRACALCRRLLDNSDVPAAMRLRALDLLLVNYQAANRPNDMVSALETAISFADPEHRSSLFRRAGSALAILGRDVEAMGHYAALLQQDPSDAEAQKQLRILSSRSKRYDLRAEALQQAALATSDDAIRVSHLCDAAELYVDHLSNTDSAVEIYSQLLTLPDIDSSTALKVAYRLDQLLATTEQDAERLPVLQRIAALEPTAVVRRTVLQEAARLAQQLENTAEALEFWNALLAQNENDLEALSAVIHLQQQQEHWEDVVQFLLRRSKAPVLREQRRSDLVQVAGIQLNYLQDLPAAIDTWISIFNEYGPRADAVEQLDDLLSRAGRYSELADLLRSAADGEWARVQQLLLRLGDIYAKERNDPAAGLTWYGNVLGLQADNPAALAAVTALLEVDTVAPQALEILVAACRRTDDIRSLLALTERRIRLETDEPRRIEVMKEAARLQKDRAGNNGEAFALLCAVLPLSPSDSSVESDILALADGVDGWEEAAKALESAAAVAVDASARQVELLRHAAKIREDHLADYDGALQVCVEILKKKNSDPALISSVIRLSARAGAWARGMYALFLGIETRGTLDEDGLRILESAAAAKDAFAALCASLENAIAETRGLRPGLVRALEMKLSNWYFDRCNDIGRATAAAERAVAADPDDLEARLHLAVFQSDRPGRAYLENLRAIYRLQQAGLEPLLKAAESAVNSLDDYEETRGHVVYLFEEAARLWRLGTALPAGPSAAECALQAVTQVARLDLENNRRDRAAQFLLEGSALPFDTARHRFLLTQAATMLTEAGNAPAAIEVYQRILERSPDDVDTLEKLDVLLEKQSRSLELLAVRRRRLELAGGGDLKVQLRLDLARLGGLLEGSDARAELLRQNLADAPGHPESLAAVQELLEVRGQWTELARILGEQAEYLLTAGDRERAAALFDRMAAICETRLSDRDRAIDAWTKVAELRTSAATLDALARLHAKKGDLAQAAHWLLARLEIAGSEERVSTMIRLARTWLQIGRGDDATQILENAFEQAPQNAEVRKLLLEQYREQGVTEKLAVVLEKSTQNVKDRKTQLAYAREAAKLYVTRMGTPARAVSVLKTVVEADPEDDEAKAMLADSLLEAKLYDEAKVLLEQILEGFGRRRSPARAAMHAKLASVLHAQGDLVTALDHLEQAAKMDTHNVAIACRLAELAREKGDLDLADRTWRSLLMTVRREQPEGATAEVGPARILLELALIAGEKGQPDKKAELQESALEALAQDDSQAAALELRAEALQENALLEQIYARRLTVLQKNIVRGKVLAKLAALYGADPARRALAFDTWLKAVEEDPGAPTHHDAAMALARELNRFDEYVRLISELLEKTRRDVDALVRCELLLRLVTIRIERNEDLDEAARLFAQAEELEVREVDVIRTGARLAGARGDRDEQIRLLTLLSNMGEGEVAQDAQVDALFRLAEIHLSSDETFDEGVAQLTSAFSQSNNFERAGRILRRVARSGADPKRLIGIFEKVARRSQDNELLLEYFEMLSRSDDTTPAQLQEGATLALQLGREETAENLMTRMVEGRETHPEQGEAISWAMLQMGRRRQAAGDLAGAVREMMDAADITDDEEVFRFGVSLADHVRTQAGDLLLAARVYERLLDLRPGAKEAWQPLADIYADLANIEGFECLVEETMYAIEDPAERNGLRLKWAELLLHEENRASDAVDVMKNVLLDDPGNIRALSMLSDYYIRSGSTDELLELLSDRFASACERRAGDEVRGLAIELGRHVDRDAARTCYRRALEVVPADRTLLLALIDTLDPKEDGRERVELLERTLASEEGESAAELTLKVASAYAEMGDGEGATRTLRKGHERIPDNDQIKKALEADFRARGDFSGLVGMLRRTAAGLSDPAARVMAFGEIADLYRDELMDVDGEMAALSAIGDVLGDNVDFTIRLIDCMKRAGHLDDALEKASSTLARTEEPSQRFELLRLRADMLKTTGDVDGALSDMEEAFDIRPADMADGLESILRSRRGMCASNGDAEAERDIVYKLAALYETVQRHEDRRALLVDWLSTAAEDTYGWQALLQVERATGNWEGVIEACKKLTVLTANHEQIDIARILTDACRRTGQLEIARRGLEYVYRENIDGISLRDDLKQIYEEIGAWGELASFHAHDANAAEDPARRADLFRKAGTAYLKAGDMDTALLALNEALSLEPENMEAAVLAIDIEIENGDLEGAEAHATDAIDACAKKRSPELAALQLRMGRIAEKNGDKVGQLNWLEQAATSDRSDAGLIARVADLAEEIQEWETALKALRNISLMKGDCPISKAESFFRQGRIAYQQGDEKRAQLFVKKAIQEDKDYQEAIDYLEQIS